MLQSSNTFSAGAAYISTTVKWWILKDVKMKTSPLRLRRILEVQPLVLSTLIYSTQGWAIMISQVTPCLEVSRLHPGSLEFSYSQHRGFASCFSGV